MKPIPRKLGPSESPSTSIVPNSPASCSPRPAGNTSHEAHRSLRRPNLDGQSYTETHEVSVRAATGASVERAGPASSRTASNRSKRLRPPPCTTVRRTTTPLPRAPALLASRPLLTHPPDIFCPSPRVTTIAMMISIPLRATAPPAERGSDQSLSRMFLPSPLARSLLCRTSSVLQQTSTSSWEQDPTPHSLHHFLLPLARGDVAVRRYIVLPHVS